MRLHKIHWINRNSVHHLQLLHQLDILYTLYTIYTEYRIYYRYGLPYSLLPLFLLWAWIIIRPCGQLYLGILPNLTVVRGALIYFRTSESLFLHINYSACPHFCQEVDDDDLEAGGLLENFHSLTRASKVTRETMNNLKTKFK